MKRLACFLVCLLPVLPAGAADVTLGAQLGRQYLDVRQTTAGVSQSTRLDGDTDLGFVVGLGRPGGGSRVAVEWNGFESGLIGLDLFSFSYSYFFPALPLSAELGLRPFLGGELGYGWLDVDATSAYNGGDDSGLLYGARTGLNLAISQRAEIELGLRYSRIGLEAERAGKGVNAGSTALYEVENNKGWWLGFNIGM